MDKGDKLVDVIDNYVIDDDDIDSFTSKLSDDGIQIISEPDGEWIGLKDAAKLTGVGDATLRRRVKENKITYKMYDSKWGQQYILKYEEIQALADQNRLKDVRRRTQQRDFETEVAAFFSHYESQYITPLSEQVNNVEQSQAQILVSIEQTQEAVKRILELIEQNQELKDTVKGLEDKVQEQQEYIDDQKKKGFFGRLFSK